MKADGTVQTFAEVAEWLKQSSDALALTAKDMFVNSQFEEVRVNAIYAKNMAEMAAKAAYQLARLLDEQSKGGKP